MNRRPLPALLLLAAVAVPAHALDAACQRVVDATDKRLAAPAFHQRQETPGFVHEVLKADGKLWMRDNGEAWAPSPLTVDQLRQGAAKARSLLGRCERTGSESVDGVATEIYRFSLTGIDGKPMTADVWIGTADGRPYREVAPGVKGSTRYTGVQAPR